MFVAAVAQTVEHILGKDKQCLQRGRVPLVKNGRKTSYAAMAQQVEHVLGKDEVTGSSPVSSSTKPQEIGVFSLYFPLNMPARKTLEKMVVKSQSNGSQKINEFYSQNHTTPTAVCQTF